MEKGNAWDLTASFRELDLNPSRSDKGPILAKHYPSSSSAVLKMKRRKAPNLLSLCFGVLGRHLEDIIDDLPELGRILPSDVKMAIAAIARRRKLLSDDVIVALAECSWEILDLSGSDVSDHGLLQLVHMCTSVRAVDISRCSKLTAYGIAELLENSRSLEVLRWGGCPASEGSARRCVRILKHRLPDIAGDSWEDLEFTEISVVAPSLRWLVWPGMNSLEFLSTECPRIIVNPKPSPFGFRGLEVPREAYPNAVFDDPVVEDIDPTTWAVLELPVTEKYTLAFLKRNNRLARKRAKNARQHQRRAEREEVSVSLTSKSLAAKSLHQ